MIQNSWKILVTKSIDDAMDCYFLKKEDKNEGKFPSWGNLPICGCPIVRQWDNNFYPLVTNGPLVLNKMDVF